jgi:hypothetical protein
MGQARADEARSQKEKAAEAALRIMLKSVVALPPSIDVPRTIPIGLTDAALHRPTRWAAVPATAVVAVIARGSASGNSSRGNKDVGNNRSRLAPAR